MEPTQPPAPKPTRKTERGVPIPIRHGNKLIIGILVDTKGSYEYYLAPRGWAARKKSTWYPGDDAGWAEAWSVFAEAEPGHAGEYLRTVARVPNQAGVSSQTLEQQRTADAPPNLGTPTAEARRTARPPGGQRLSQCLGWGIGLLVVGGLMAGLAWPRTEADLVFGGVNESGIEAAAIVGLLIVWAGALVLQVAIIGYGVKFGREASPDVDR